MDMQKIGAFLTQLRKEQNLTQEELGEKIGVTNKTISRWENGNYLPPVEMLLILSKFYGVSINEILSGERLNDATYKENAEKNIVTALHNSTIDFPEKARFYRNKWRKKHWVELLFEFLALFALLICGTIFSDKGLLEFCSIISILFAWWINNRMDYYVYTNIYEEKYHDTNNQKQ